MEDLFLNRRWLRPRAALSPSRIQGSGFRVEGLRVMVEVKGFRFQVLKLRVEDSGFGVWGEIARSVQVWKGILVFFRKC